MAQEPSSRELLEAVKQAESGGRRYKADGKTLLEGPQTKYGTAKGEMQVLDMTNRDPGFGVKPARDDSPDERARVGRDYLAAMTKRYGDTETGLIAYNWGPGNTDKWLKGGADPAKLPKETQKYVANITASLGGTKVAKAAPAKVAPTKAAPTKVAPTKVAKADVPERRTGAALLQTPLFSQLGANYQAALAVSMLADEAEKEDKDEDAPSEAEKMLAAMPSAPAPAAAPELELGYQSPFPEARAPAQPVGRGFLPMLRPVRMAEGGEVALPDIGDAPAREELLRFFANRETAPGMGDVTMAGAGKNFQVGGGNLNINAALTSLSREEKQYLAKNLMASYMRNIGDATVGLNINKQLDIPDEVYRAALMGSLPIGGGRAMISAQGTRVNGQNYPVNQQIGYEYPIGSGQLSVSASRMKDIPKSDQYQLQYRMPIGRAKGSPEEGEVSYFQDPMGAPSAPVTKDTLAKGREFSAADALRILRETGTDVARNVKNVAKGTTETPYNFFGAAADIGNMALTPLGLGSAEPFLGSAQLKRLATEAGIRPAPPTDPRDAGYYMMGELGASVVNPAGVVRSGVKATGKAAKMLEDMTVGNIQRGQVRRAGAQAENIPDTAYDPLRQRMEASGNLAYAVRNKGTPFTVSYGPIKGPDGNYLVGPDRFGNYLAPMDDAQKYVQEEVAITGDSKLNDWLSDKVTSYLRRDFATPDDQFVKAAKDNQLLHFVNKPIPKRPDLDPYYNRINDFSSIKNLPYVRETERFNPLGEVEAIKPYAKRVETLTDASAYPVQLQDVSTKNIPSRMRNMVETNPTTRLTELGPNIGKMLQLDDLATSMEKMRSMPKTYSAYSQPAIKVPEEYLFTDKALVGLTPAQASNRVATFRNWQQENRQKMASKYMKEDARLDREELSGKFTAVALPDLQKSPEIKQLAMDVGCDGNWCTKKQADALGYGSGENRLHIILDEKARPLAQLTLSDLSPAAKRLGKDFLVGKRYSLTELLGKDNSKDFSKNPALPAIQQYVKSLDNKYGLAYVTNLKEIKMKEMDPVDLIRGATDLSQIRQRYKPGITQEQYEAAFAPDLADLTAKVRELNGGSRFFTSDQDTKDLVQQALKLLTPQQRATGGMVERQVSTARYI